MVYTTHTRIVGDVRTTTVHGRQETLELYRQQLAVYNRYADVYLGDCILIVRERTDATN